MSKRMKLSAVAAVGAMLVIGAVMGACSEKAQKDVAKTLEDAAAAVPVAAEVAADAEAGNAPKAIQDAVSGIGPVEKLAGDAIEDAKDAKEALGK